MKNIKRSLFRSIGLLVKDEAGNKNCYAMKELRTLTVRDMANKVINPGFEADNSCIQSIAGWVTSGDDGDADHLQEGGYSGIFH